MTTVKSAFNRLSKLAVVMSSMGRAAAATAYGLSKTLYMAEHSGLPPPPIAAKLKQATVALVDRGAALAGPTAEAGAGHTRGSLRRLPPPGVPSHLLVGQPKSGGFGLLPLTEHTQARHACLARRLIAFGVRSPEVLLPSPQPDQDGGTGTMSPAPPILQPTPLWVYVTLDLLAPIFPQVPPPLALVYAATPLWDSSPQGRRGGWPRPLGPWGP